MTIEKDTVTATEKAIMKEKDAVAPAKKENMKKTKADDARGKATEDVKLAVSKYIEELKKKEGSLPKIAEKLHNIHIEIKTASSGETDTVDTAPPFLKNLGNWLRKEAEPSLYHLCLLTQVNHDSYDYILGLDKNANHLSYGYTLDFFFYLFRTKKLGILRSKYPGLCETRETPTMVASKACFEMTRYLIFKDETLCDIFKELYYQRQIDKQKRDKNESRYKEALQQFISKYENTLLVSETCGIDKKIIAPLLSDSGQNKPSQETYHGLPEDLADRLGTLPEKHKKTQAQFSRDAGIPPSTFNGWVNYGTELHSSNLYLLAKTYGFSIDSFLQTDESDKNEKEHPYKYTYGNTLRFIDQLETTGVISAAINLNYVAPSEDSTPHYTKNPDGKNPNNLNYSRDGESAYLSGIFFIRDDFLIRLITETEAEMSRPFAAPQRLDTAQIGYEMSQQSVKEFIAKYDNENLLCYQKGIREALGKCSEKWRKYYYGYNNPWAFTLDMSVDLDEMLEELRVAEKEASKALQNGNTRKQET